MGQLDFKTDRRSALRHPDGPQKISLPVPNACRDAFLTRMREWVIAEQIERATRQYGSFEIQAGYLMALSNMMEVMIDLEKEVTCRVSMPTRPEIIIPKRSVFSRLGVWARDRIRRHVRLG
jgi:hypothetical protein